MATVSQESSPPRGALGAIGAALRGTASSPSGLAGLTIVALHLAVALGAPILAPYNPTLTDSNAIMAAPSGLHWFGTDALGRDVLSRTIYGGRIALATTFPAALLAVAWGGLLGIAAGFLGGRVDQIMMRLIDAFLAIPWLLFLLVIASIVGTGGAVLVPTLAFFYGLPIVRVVRGATLDIVAMDFVSAARARGERKSRIVWRELLPNVRDILLVEGAMEWSWMLLAFSSLSFLGFGVTPPTADWGLMISDARLYLTVIPLAALAPMTALAVLIIGINLAVDALGKTLGIDRVRAVGA